MMSEAIAYMAAPSNGQDSQSDRPSEESTERVEKEFLLSVAEEMRRSMQTLQRYSDLVIQKLEHVPMAKLGGYMERYDDCENRLLSLLNELMDLSKQESTSTPYDIRENDLMKVLDRCALKFLAYCQVQGIALRVDKFAVPTEACFDAAYIEQVITNLFSFVIELTPEGQPVYVTFAEDALTDGSQNASSSETVSGLRLTIGNERGEDLSVPEDELEVSIFEKSNRYGKIGDASREPTSERLALCKKIIEDHQGKIWATYVPDGETAFSFVIPRKSA